MCRIKACEEFLRVRYHGDIARIELGPKDISLLLNDELRNSSVTKFKKTGFPYVTLDLEGYRSGAMNEVLKTK